MRALRDNLLLQFSFLSFVILVVVALVIANTLAHKIRSNAIDDLADEAVGTSMGRLLSAITPEDLEIPMSGDRYDKFHEFVQTHIVSDRTARVKLWSKEGTVIYSDETAQVGQQFPIDEEMQEALAGKTAVEISVPNKAENEAERSLGTLMEVYSPIMLPGDSAPQGVFEIYQYYAPTAQRIKDLQRVVFVLTSAGFLMLYGALVSIVWHGWRTICTQRRDLKLANAQLEVRVDQRTAELKAANQRLTLEMAQREQAEEQLLHDAFFDSLTGLPNRALFIDRLGVAARRAQRRKEHLFAVLFLDLDRFKNINDSLGHMAGDELLVETARRLQACLRSNDTIARLGGDEFAVLLDEIEDASDASLIADRMQDQLRKPINVGGQEVFITVSIGIALSTEEWQHPDDLLRDADTAMYRAKALGRARKEVFNQSMHFHAMERLQLETDLRRAIEHQEFLVHYQPIISLKDSRLVGFEALIRWQHPDRGLVAPDDFIPVAEETGLIIPIGLWVLREACHQMSLWQQQNPTNPQLIISVNISSKQLLQPDLPEHVEQILKETALDACNLKLEITESVVMEHPDTARAMLSQLKTLGVQLHIDDFGIGYSSLSYLNTFPIDALKIDRSFVSRIPNDGEMLEIIRTIVTLARSLGIDVIAEGIEVGEQLAQLKELSCDYGQGYFFAKPMDSEAARAMIATKVVPIPAL